MGVHFLEHLGGCSVFHCKKCRVPLTNRELLQATNFVSGGSPAYLFKRVVNVMFGKVANKTMMTGKHWTCDVMCKKCDTTLGWMYEFAYEKEQTYKEGQVVLVLAHITEHESFGDFESVVETTDIDS